ncbi:restriction endonuclease subunit S [Streptococcus parasanguinis]|uniref:restriction endonuclease subunit S n=1 Tax=Streptococcus parasanguinis TaxID=1318 RepID=UPI00080B5D8C|nr:restriction endonuclease subunit S [Streptococcus parasanguinis]
MSIKKEKIPVVRFRDFSEPWIKNQLSEVAEFSKGRGYSKKNLQSHGTPIILYGRLYTNYESVISNVETYANLEENSVVSEGGEVIIPASGESADDISRASCVIDRGIILGGDLNIVRPHEYLNSLFIAITLSNGSQQRELSKRAQGKSVVHLHNSDLKAVKLFYPSYEEQSAIGSLFRTIDDLLASYKDNLANYQSLKATMLSKMFPKAGQTVPEIRLDGFEGEWKIKELGKVIKFYSGLTYKPSDVLSSGTLVLRSSNVREGELIYTDNVFVNPGIVNCENVKLGDIVVVVRNGSRDLIGKHALIKSEMPNTVIGAFMTGIRCDNPEFINALLDTKMFIYEINRNLGATINQITTGNFKKMKFYFPLTDEQQAIGAYFSNLDNLIAAHQEKITQLETLKKKLLQDMFI